MKACIVTLYGEFNYGNRLQNYALQTVLESFGFTTTSLAVVRETNLLKRLLKKYIEKQGHHIRIRPGYERKREKKFQLFTKHFIHTEFFFEQNGRLPQEAGNADRYVVGSDQVWNPLFWEDRKDSPELYNYLLGFTSKRKISYAASFGISELPSPWLERIRPLISSFHSLSIREREGLSSIDRLGRSAEVSLDPTLLLTAEQWRLVESNIVTEKSKYALLYFLGSKPQNLQFDSGLELIDLMDVHSRWYTSSPDSFLELIDKAAVVYTDSFHAAVFSILFHTPFAIFKRQHRNHSDMSGRLITLLETAGITDGFSENNIKILQAGIAEDEKLFESRQRSMNYLATALL